MKLLYVFSHRARLQKIKQEYADQTIEKGNRNLASHANCLRQTAVEGAGGPGRKLRDRPFSEARSGFGGILACKSPPPPP